MLPFNIEILRITDKTTQALRPIRTMDSFDGATGNFNEDGLFSASIFGRPGDKMRNLKFSYIDIKVPVFQPTMFFTLTSLKQLYTEIISGSSYAIWDEEKKDFFRADPINGETGYAFFTEHWKEINLVKNNSDRRAQAIDLITKYRDRAMTDRVLVIPAGLRDMEISDTGRAQEDDINSLYRQIYAIANTINVAATKHNIELLDKQRWTLQLRFNELYRNIEARIEGKKKLLMGGWASRKIYNGTRNVITAMNPNTSYLGKPGSISVNDTIIGLYQMLKAVLPISVNLIKNGFLKSVFFSPNVPARLLAKTDKGWEEKSIVLKPENYNRWTSNEGIEKIITLFSDVHLRNRPIVIEGYYLGLTYKGPDGTFKFIHHPDEIPEERRTKEVMESLEPITLAELFYGSFYKRSRFPLFITRYPVTGNGSIYPSFSYVKTTTVSEERVELDDSWNYDIKNLAHHFPVKTSEWNDSLSPHSIRIGRLGADYDGDMCSSNAVYTEEAVNEITNFQNSRRAYINTNGEFINTTAVATVELVFHNFSKPKK